MGKTKKRFPAVCQKWDEIERDWGTRPDGYSLHLSFADLTIFTLDYQNGLEEEDPDEYSLPDGEPYYCLIDEKIFSEVRKSEHGIWRTDENYPEEYDDKKHKGISFYDMNMRELYLRDEEETKTACATIKMIQKEQEKRRNRD